MRIGRIRGTQLMIHNGFIGIMVCFSLVGLLPKAAVVFGCILLHELAHVLVAVGYGLRVSEIEILPIGGVARIQGLMDTSPAVEKRIALAGPLVNFGLAGAAWVIGRYTEANWQSYAFFLQTNLALGFFNLLPALPLDGGRIYRAGLTSLVGYRQATEQAANTGRITAICLAAAGCWSIYYGVINLTLFFLAVFLYLAATRERGMASYICMRHLTKKKAELFDRGVLITAQFTAVGTTPLRDIVRWFEPQKYHTVYVVEEDCRLMGLLTETEILAGIMAHGVDAPVGRLVKKENH
ncbi:MAG TPA: peptidase M50 [Firmicutes bacterium]|nr:peptidase M50 [Bacillota bacterium]HWR55457.1 site-2 protease family protein [Negativicutes bacterium]